MIGLQQGMNIVLAANASTSNMGLLSKALLNTVIGMGIVFVVLIFISYIISLLKYIPKLIEKFTNSGNSNNIEIEKEPAIDYETSLETGDSVDISVTDNAELVAVITAAIMASMGNEVPNDGLIVRSIRKINRSR
ncbi:OadG family protein [Anaerocolumna sp.]|uniref:OadG family protein n=1 Tax=Anaerocolumna sp. TaxID=2041569 RepID=UPI0028AED660|nr:OadG family protein [Anaerocolumna sp.]